MGLRLFVAIELADDVAAAALELISRLRSTAERLAPRSRLTWMTEGRLHVTVHFIGHVDDGKVDAIRGALAPPFDIDPFDLTIATVGTFPSRGTPRVVWAGVTGGREPLISIERAVSARLVGAGVMPEERPFRPHLTLARVRDGTGLRSADLINDLRNVTVGTTQVDAITLFESRLSPKGPAYVALQRTSVRHRSPR